MLLSILGLALGFIVLGGIFFFLLFQPTSPAVVLPGKETAALLRYASGDDLKMLTTLYPILSSVPAAASGSSVAVIRLPSGSLSWAVFPRENASFPSDQGSWISLGTQKLLVSDPGIQSLLGKKENQLVSYEPYKRLASPMSQDESWNYLELAVLKQHNKTPLDRQIQLLFADADYAALLHQENTWTFTVFAEQWQEWPGLSPAQHSPSSKLSVHLNLSDPVQQGSALLASLSEDEKSILQGLLLQLIHEHFGSDVSLASDVLPLLLRPATLSLRPNTANGTTDILLEGSMPNETGLKDQMTAFHARIASQLPAMIVTRKTLDRGFTSTLVQSDPSAIIQETAEVEGWTVKTTAHTGNLRAFSTAVRQNRFLMGTDAAWIKETVTGTAREQLELPTSLHLRNKTPIAGGSINLQSLPALAEAIPLFDLQSDVLPFLHLREGTLLWTAEQAGNLRSFTVRLAP